MRTLKYVALTVVLLLTTLQLAYAAKGKRAKTIYVFGVATSFNDSTAYVTVIQQLDSVTTVGKTDILANKQEYSYQLREFMDGKGVQHATCVTVNAKSRKEAEKSLNSMKQRLADKNKLIVKQIPAEEFVYQRVVMAH